MSFSDPGHVNNLTAAQESMLRQFWAVTLSDLSSDPLDKKLASLYGLNMSALLEALPGRDTSNAATLASRSVSTSSTSSASPGQKKGWIASAKGWGRWGSGKTDNTTAQAAETASISSSSSFSSEEFEDANADGANGADAEEYMKGATEAKEDPLASVGSASKQALLQQLYYASGGELPDLFPLRFLRARKWVLPKAYAMCSAALQWRERVNVKNIRETGEDNVGMRPFESGKGYFLPKPDLHGRPVVVVHTSRHDKVADPLEESEKFTIWQMEVGRLLVQAPGETTTILFDMTNFGLRNMDWPMVKILIGCFEAYYPESLGFGLIVNAPWIFNSIWKIIKGILDPVVAEKFHFAKSSELDQYLRREAIPKCLGGTYDFQYTKASEAEKASRKALMVDLEGRANAESAWKSAWEEYRVATREWIIAGAAFDNLTSTSSPESKKILETYKAAAAKRLASHGNVKKAYALCFKWWQCPGVLHRHGLLKSQ